MVRLSGPDAKPFAQAILGHVLTPRHATYARFLDARGDVLDAGIALYFPAPASFTGEEVLELQGHGGPQVLQLVLDRCLELGARLAEPGEFSRRAFLNGKIDLAQAEAIADLIDAQSQAAARSAVRTLNGEFSRHVHALVEGLIRLRTLVEATLDFPEEDIDFLEQADAAGQLATLAQNLGEVLAQARQGALLRNGLNIVLIGQPNVGKSSLLNRLAGFEAAIVTEIAGTTRDAIREAIQLEGVPLHIIDTAGLRDTDDPVEREGIARTWQALAQADMALLLVDATHGVGVREHDILARLPVIPVLTVHNKIDLGARQPGLSGDGNEIWLSAKTGVGIDLLRQRLLALAGWQSSGEGSLMARERHIQALKMARVRLDAARACLPQPEILAEELRLAQEALARITGEFSADDLLGEIFGKFCIGK